MSTYVKNQLRLKLCQHEKHHTTVPVDVMPTYFKNYTLSAIWHLLTLCQHISRIIQLTFRQCVSRIIQLTLRQRASRIMQLTLLKTCQNHTEPAGVMSAQAMNHRAPNNIVNSCQKLIIMHVKIYHQLICQHVSRIIER